MTAARESRKQKLDEVERSIQKKKVNVLFLSGRYGGVPDPMPLTNPKRDGNMSLAWLSMDGQIGPQTRGSCLAAGLSHRRVVR